ncbi:hypothetical protein HMPREF0673_01163 [Leyella stercorea DSM 18206]|uniref:Uncharacterized protein n=1 Tax=Leyella stercorea DSM 18206 TaxID=1002367 RepID=G6AX13_9BACT|nr:hypothetical protein HMPREF0673_01163 [Leyella stercorea DSM 18206]
MYSQRLNTRIVSGICFLGGGLQRRMGKRRVVAGRLLIIKFL